MGIWVKVVVRLLFGAGDVWTFVRWLTSDGVTACVNLGAPEYAALAFLFTVGLIAVSLEPLGKLRDVVMLQCSPARRTYALLDDFKTLERTLQGNYTHTHPHTMQKASPRVKVPLESLVYKLDKLDIPRPTIAESSKIWHHWVASFIAAIKAREYKAALNLWEKHGQKNVTR